MSSPPLLHAADPSCPFCAIAAAFPPVAPSSTIDSQSPTSLTDSAADPLDPEKTFPPSYVLLSTPDVVAFLDIAPLTRGHILLATRQHRVKTVDLTTSEGAELGRVLPLLARSVLRAVFPDLDPSETDYNFVQNNGPRAAQVVPHIHFHLIPRPATGSNTGPGTTTFSATPSFAQQSWLSFGRGMRTELDDDDAAVLVRQIRTEVRREVERIKVDEGVDLEVWWGLGLSLSSTGGAAHGLGRGKADVQNADRGREKL